ncbi:hypothetical protein PV783_34240 [Chitinophaga sp. CC14]|uniref:hypothetical protein n=1 Tax=Chitinophaga sp. CC14 TaxID=3029199 RepID=UPI003B7EDF9E
MAGILQGKIQNKGAKTYKVYYRKKGTGDPWAGGVEFPASSGEFTTILFNDVPAGQYESYVISICADGSTSVDSPLFYSQLCERPTSFTVTERATDFLVEYGLPGLVTVFNIRMELPNGGIQDRIYTADGTGQVIIAKPANTYGDFIFSMRSVCNQSGQWYSDYSNSVLINLPQPSGCPPPVVSTSARIATSSGGDTWRITLASNTTSVRVVTTNTTTGAQPQTTNQPVTGNYIEIFLPRGSINYNYTVDVYNVCAVGTDTIGDGTEIMVPASIVPVSTSGWTVVTAPETTPVNGVFGSRVTVNTGGSPPSATQDCLVTVRYSCTGGAYAYVDVIVSAGQASGVVRNFSPSCTIDTNSAFINSAVLV